MTAIALVSTNCAVCARPLTDAVSAQLGVGPECAATYGYTGETISPNVRDEANQIVHDIADNNLGGHVLRDALLRLAELGFRALALRIERRVRRRISHAQQQELVVDVDVSTPAPVAVDLPFKLTQGQEQAREMVQRLRQRRVHSVGVVRGFAGTGKTTTVKVIAADNGRPIVITPTGRAALRVRQATGVMASTIHRWLYAVVQDEKSGAIKFVRKEPDDIEIPPSRLVLVDEASMVGPDVWKDVHKICQQLDLTLILVGDAFQLPPVQAPNAAPFSVMTPEFAASINAESVELTEVLRQAQDSPVIRASMLLRGGAGLHALAGLPRIESHEFWQKCIATYRAGGIIICHRNATRFSINAMMRSMFGFTDELPQPGEPLMVTKNSYEAGVMNGESIPFEAWKERPDVYERVHDRWKNAEQNMRFGGATIDNGKITVTLAVEELHGKVAEVGPKAIEIAAQKWARLNSVYNADSLAPHVHANFGYGYTCHKSQGSQWPYVLVCLEPSVRLNEEEGRRWTYTAVTRAEQMTALFYSST